jgi:CRISPR-associated protein Cas5t
MKVFIIDLTSWTASFRYPNLISGFQPTLEVPPLSTVLGLINAAAGSYQRYSHLTIGYYFEYEAKAVDLETIYQVSSNDGRPTNQAKSNVINREFLFNTFLRLYVVDEKIADFFRKPYYPLLLGRMNDLATVNKIESLTLSPVENADKIKGQIVPFAGNRLAGQIQALPKYFTDTFPRNNIGTEPYSVISHRTNTLYTPLKALRDVIGPNQEIDVYFHEIDFAQYDYSGDRYAPS